MVEDLVDFESHSLTRPHSGDFAEPAIYKSKASATLSRQSRLLTVFLFGSNWPTFDGGVSDFAHSASAAVRKVPLKAFRVKNKWGSEQESAIDSQCTERKRRQVD